jgi:beta-glucosidase
MSKFPEGFRWGVATSAYQIEGAWNADGRGPSIWDTFTHTSGTIEDGTNGDVACDHYHRFAEDVSIMRELGVDAYRFSVSWSRMIPEGTDEVNPEGIAFYRDLCQELRSAGITPIITLYHWDLPQALQDRGGWLSRDSVEWFTEYATVAKQELGDLVRVWTTFNEPWCAAFLGHSSGDHAPGQADPGAGFVAAHHLMLAHHAAIRALRETNVRDDDELGIVLNLIPAWPQDPDSEGDALAAEAVDAVQNQLFLDAVFEGTIPDHIRSAHERYGVADQIDAAELAQVKSPIDFLGVNYYNINRVAHAAGSVAPAAWPGADEARFVPPTGWADEMGWAPEPEGLLWMLRRVTDEYGSVPIVICENGTALADDPGPDGTIDDRRRIAYLSGHIDAVAEALARGVDMRGYMVWSLLDNFEWAHGYTKHFGLVYVDPDTLDRTIKASGHWYADFIARTRS